MTWQLSPWTMAWNLPCQGVAPQQHAALLQVMQCTTEHGSAEQGRWKWLSRCLLAAACGVQGTTLKTAFRSFLAAAGGAERHKNHAIFVYPPQFWLHQLVSLAAAGGAGYHSGCCKPGVCAPARTGPALSPLKADGRPQPHGRQGDAGYQFHSELNGEPTCLLPFNYEWTHTVLNSLRSQ